MKLTQIVIAIVPWRHIVRRYYSLQFVFLFPTKIFLLRLFLSFTCLHNYEFVCVHLYASSPQVQVANASSSLAMMMLQ